MKKFDILEVKIISDYKNKYEENDFFFFEMGELPLVHQRVYYHTLLSQDLA